MDNYWSTIKEIGKEQADKIVEIEKFKDNIDQKYFKIFDQINEQQT
jgi:ribulose bisphosphate carboxylase small subunit